jgi:hypothetical protein
VPELNKAPSNLTLGWKVDLGLAPKYWLKHDAKPGAQESEDLVRVPANTLGCHTAIVAQSGSGKSFFLGRLIEELLLETKSRCVILDPNADFRKVVAIIDKSYWDSAGYDHKNYRGFLPHEASRTDFSKRWRQIPIRVQGGPLFKGKGTRLRVLWTSLSYQFLSDDVVGMQQSDLYHCHEFVSAIASILEPKSALHAEPESQKQEVEPKSESVQVDFIDEANRILKLAKESKPQYHKNLIEHELTALLLKAGIEKTKDETQQLLDRAAAAVEYISDDIQRYYFGKAKEYASQRIVITRTSKVRAPRKPPPRLDVYDLPSFPNSKTRFLALNSVLSTIWEEARSDWARAVQGNDEDTRKPTFIVVDEAHNLIPKDTSTLATHALREQFRSIAAEGRKYGLFLILCTQRPDKIDDLVLSECENKAIMKLGSQSVMNITRKLLGLEDIQDTVLRKCLEFETGRALLTGRWAKGGSLLLYTAMRRTKEGGKNLSDSFWATPEEVESLPVVPENSNGDEGSITAPSQPGPQPGASAKAD